MEINSASIDNNIVHVGSQRRSFHCDEWTSTKIIIHEFAKLPRNETIISPEFKCLDHQWCLVIPKLRGDYIPMHLVSASSKKSINIEYMITVRDKNDEQVYKSIRKVYCFNSLNPMDCETTNRMGESFNIMGYVQALGYMKEYGALVIEVHMKQTVEVLPPFIPENPLITMTQDKFLNEKSSDVLFEVGVKEEGTTKILVVRNFFLKGSSRWGRQEPAAKKLMNSPFSSATMSTISSASFPAHRFILQLCSTTLAELCESATDKTSPIQISGVSLWAFYFLLYYNYGGKIEWEELEEVDARELIDAADRFGVINLKLEAEVQYVELITITTGNVVELLLYADSKNCALLKEAAIDFMAENAVKVLEKVSLKDVPGGLYADLLAAMVRIGGEDKRIADSSTNGSIVMNELIAMRISELRRQAHEEGLDYDGSREVLIDALKSEYESDMEIMDD